MNIIIQKEMNMYLNKYIGKQAKYLESPLSAIVRIEDITFENDYYDIKLFTLKGFNKNEGFWNIGSITNFISFSDNQISVGGYLNWELNIIN